MLGYGIKRVSVLFLKLILKSIIQANIWALLFYGLIESFLQAVQYNYNVSVY